MAGFALIGTVVGLLLEVHLDAYCAAAELSRERCCYESDEEFEAAMGEAGDWMAETWTVLLQVEEVAGV